MGYDRGDSFPFDFEPNGIQFGSKSKGKLYIKKKIERTECMHFQLVRLPAMKFFNPSKNAASITAV